MKAFLIIDVQNDYFPGGKSELVGAAEALENIEIVLKRFRAAKLPVIHIQHINTRAGATFFLPGTPGVEIHSNLTPLGGEDVLVKHAPNSFYETGLGDLLRLKSIDSLVVGGMMTHMCIDTTVRAAKDYGIPVTLLYNACAAKDLSIMGHSIPALTVHNAYMAGLNGMFAQVVLTKELQI